MEQDRPVGASIVAYYRVSTPRQGKSGLGLEAQRKAAGIEFTEARIEAIEMIAGERPRTDQRHLAFNDVQKLGEFIQAGTP